jgi:hypothetical protein
MMRPIVMLVALAGLASDAGPARAMLGPGDTSGVSITVGSLAAKGSGLQHTLTGNPDPVDVVVRFGGLTYCQHYGGLITFKTPKLYSAKLALAGSCPSSP